MIKIQENHTYSIYEIRFRRILKVCKKKKKHRKKFFDFIIHDAIFWVIHHLSLFRFFPLSLKRLASLVDELLGAKTMGKTPVTQCGYNCLFSIILKYLYLK